MDFISVAVNTTQVFIKLLIYFEEPAAVTNRNGARS